MKKWLKWLCNNGYNGYITITITNHKGSITITITNHYVSKIMVISNSGLIIASSNLSPKKLENSKVQFNINRACLTLLYQNSLCKIKRDYII